MTVPEMLQDCDRYLRENKDPKFKKEFQLMNTYYGDILFKKQ